MIILITGASHTGKTMLAQKMLEKYGYPYLSIDHLKMGLIRSGNTNLTPEDSGRRLRLQLRISRILSWRAAISHLTGGRILTSSIWHISDLFALL